MVTTNEHDNVRVIDPLGTEHFFPWDEVMFLPWVYWGGTPEGEMREIRREATARGHTPPKSRH
jgi:hypothetical protein